MTEASKRLEEARQAYQRYDWVAARDGFYAASEEIDLSLEDRYAVAQCWWSLGDLGEYRRELEDLHHRALESDAPGMAATAALELALLHLLRGDEPVGSGWLGRAARLAERLTDGPIHGYLSLVLEVEPDFTDVDPSDVIDAARNVQDIGRRHGDPTLVTSGINAEGRALVRAGRIEEGLALLDETMVAVLAGEVPDQKWVGNLYCTTLSACHDLGDLRRMARWTEAFERSRDTIASSVLIAADCRVHRAQLLTFSGDWDRAEREAAQASEEFAGISSVNAAEAWYQVGEIRRRRGHLDAAEQAYQAAHAYGRDPQPGLALLRLVQGRNEAAATAIHAALLASRDDQAVRAQLCAAQVEIAVADGRLDLARQAADELGDIAASAANRGLEATADKARGAVLLADGRPEEALPPLRQACGTWRDLDAPYEAARARVLLARAYDAFGDEEAADRELAAAASAFDRLGARIDAAEVAALRGSDPRPGGLSEREIEVLRLVAQGQSNPEIAGTLFISRKTVARHMSNIFHKLGVSSRTEAARFAFDHGLLTHRSG